MQKKGISLIVLVITIIVMIILAATVVISLTSNSVIDRASQAVKLTDEKQVQDLAALTWSEMYLDNHRDDDLRREVMEKLIEQGVDTNKYHIVISNTGVSVSTTPTKLTTLAGTKWKFNEHISDYDFLEVFDFEEQTGWEQYPMETTIVTDLGTYNLWGLALSPIYECIMLSTVQSNSDEYTFNYIPENNLGVEAGWYGINKELRTKFFSNSFSSIDELINGLVTSNPPTISFANESNAAVTNPELIDWLYENATKIG